MRRKTNSIIAAAAIGTALAAWAGIAMATSPDDEDRDERDTPMIGADLDRAAETALQHTGGGRVTDTEVGDEESYYEVEVTLDDGTQVDVQLDEAFTVVGEESDVAGDDE